MRKTEEIAFFQNGISQKHRPFLREIWIYFSRPNKLSLYQTAACYLSSFERYTLAKITAISTRLSLIYVMYKLVM